MLGFLIGWGLIMILEGEGICLALVCLLCVGFPLGSLWMGWCDLCGCGLSFFLVPNLYDVTGGKWLGILLAGALMNGICMIFFFFFGDV